MELGRAVAGATKPSIKTVNTSTGKDLWRLGTERLVSTAKDNGTYGQVFCRYTRDRLIVNPARMVRLTPVPGQL
ncbi:hypothetical protein RRG08_057548 [Elysia crispata]|uniref:Uncharacterized protein n=1 Tax=Elysia crispata TaxID=231223 RepID=A0AAE1AAH0_9GAST|nr:hypothetical protein RRG08_057548 [Elysia crispata]